MKYFRSKEDRRVRLERLLVNMLSTMDIEQNRTDIKKARNKIIKKNIEKELKEMGLKFDSTSRKIIDIKYPTLRNEIKHQYSLAQDEYIRCKSLATKAQENLKKAKQVLEEKRELLLNSKKKQGV